MGRINNKITLDSINSNTNSPMVKCGAFRNQGVTLITTGFTGTIKFYASNASEVGIRPDLSAAASTTNEFSTVRSINLQDGNPIAGATGITFTADTSVTRYEVNDNNVQWLGFITSSVTAGSIEIKIDLTDNQ